MVRWLNIRGSEAQEVLLADAEQTPVGELVRLVRGQSLTRARYLLRAYLRARLLKLERFCMSALDDEDTTARLSPTERQYAQARSLLWKLAWQRSVQAWDLAL